LQAVVHDDDVDAQAGEEFCPARPVRRHNGWTVPSQEKRLVADVARIVDVQGNDDGAGLRAAVAARQKSRIEPQAPADIRHFKGGGGLAGAAEHDIADA
jgi:hypothetical protein